MSRLPTIFISHGAPDLAMTPGATTDFLRDLPHHLPSPRAILVISAHWSTRYPAVGGSPHPAMIYDFMGFPAALYQLTYPAPGDPALAAEIQQRFTAAGLPITIDAKRGLDHGAWAPLLLTYPEATIPVLQLSVQPALGTEHHWQMGQILAPLRESGVLILASGGATHNLGALRFTEDTIPPAWVQDFDDWLAEHLLQNDVESLLDYRHKAPYAAQNHPSAEHLMPLFVALGAGNGATTCLHRSYTYGVLSMAAYQFD